MKHLERTQFTGVGAGATQVESLEEDAFALSLSPQGGYLLLADDAFAELAAGWREQHWLVVDAVNTNDHVQGLVFGFWKKETVSELGKRLYGFVGGGDSATSGEYPRPDLLAILGLFPGLPTRIAFPLSALNAEKLFLDRTPGKLKTIVLGNKMPLAEVGALTVGLKPTHTDQEVILTNLRLEEAEPDYPLPEQLLVDELGQWTGRSWPGKTKDIDQLVKDLKTDAGEAGTAVRPTDRTEGTGFFRAEHDGRRHWLVDPDGYPFYSIGVDCVNESITARTDGLEKLYSWLPPEDGDLAAHWSSGRGGRYFDFLGANFVRAFGDEWWTRWQEITTAHLLRWGFNTVGNWSSERYVKEAAMPYVWPLQGFPKTETTVFRDFPDVFSEEYARNAESFAEQLADFRGDRYLIGYFLRNEPQWAFVGDLNLGEALLENPAPLATKDALIEFLSERYGGDISKLVSAWEWPSAGTSRWTAPPAAFEDLRRPVRGVATMSRQARADLDEFSYRMVERYVSVPSVACRSVDPDHMNLGMRWAWISQDALYAGSEHFDVFSINSYKDTPAAEITRVGERTGKPVLVGEFHHGGLDRGLPATGIRGVATQRERGLAYRHYVETAAANPYSVGVHYFTLYDQAILGRFDGENFQIGLLDTCNRPYEEFVAEVSATNSALLEVCRGSRGAFAEAQREATIGF